MIKIAEKPDLLNIRVVKVCAKARGVRFSEFGKPFFGSIIGKMSLGNRLS